jgi:hypothetical protein
MEVAVAERSFSKMAMKILGDMPVKIPAGGTARVAVGASFGKSLPRFHFELSDPPEGITIKQVTPASNGLEITLQGDAAKLKPGLKGNLIVGISSKGGDAPAKSKGKGQANQRRTPLATLPAIPFEVVAP